MIFDVYKAGNRISTDNEEQISQKFDEKWSEVIFGLDAGDSVVFVYENAEWEIIRIN